MPVHLTQSRLKEALLYDPVTGNFYHNLSGGGKKAGDLAGYLNSSSAGKKEGYIDIRVDGVLYQAHRLAFLYMVGRWPIEIDHINGDHSRNEWENLREATHQENCLNSCIRSDNTSGIKGVGLHSSGAWRARIKVNGKEKHLGLFKTKEEAGRVVKTARQKYHGQFHLHE
jgi:hypothetical protein